MTSNRITNQSIIRIKAANYVSLFIKLLLKLLNKIVVNDDDDDEDDEQRASKWQILYSCFNNIHNKN